MNRTFLDLNFVFGVEHGGKFWFERGADTWVCPKAEETIRGNQMWTMINTCT